jgi:hypothetical protein
MQHIPEERLHAYLDQALERAECGAIESHLAVCDRCRADRDEVIALRDRTAALLARAVPRDTAGPPYTWLRARAQERLHLRSRRLQRAAWAASVVAALGTGWGAASWYAIDRADQLVASRPAAAPSGAASRPSGDGQSRDSAGVALAAAAEAVQPATEERSEAHAPHHTAAHPAKGGAPAANPRVAHSAGELATVGGIPKDGQLENGGVWRTVSWDGAKREAGGATPPRIAGLPVVEVQVQGGDSGKRPLMVVAQQLASGEVIRAIEGPAADVSALLGTRPSSISGESAATAVPSAPSSPAALGSALALRRGDRVVAVTGSVSRDSLKAIMQRLNLIKR